MAPRPSRDEAYDEIPEFRSHLPKFDHTLTPFEQWMVEELTIQKKQNDWIIQRMARGNKRFDRFDDDMIGLSRQVQELAEWKQVFTAKKAMFIGICAVFFVPLLVTILGDWLKGLITGKGQ